MMAARPRKKKPTKRRPDSARVVARITATRNQPVRIGGYLVEVPHRIKLVILEEIEPLPLGSGLTQRADSVS